MAEPQLPPPAAAHLHRPVRPAARAGQRRFRQVSRARVRDRSSGRVAGRGRRDQRRLRQSPRHRRRRRLWPIGCGEQARGQRIKARRRVGQVGGRRVGPRQSRRRARPRAPKTSARSPRTCLARLRRASSAAVLRSVSIVAGRQIAVERQPREPGQPRARPALAAASARAHRRLLRPPFGGGQAGLGQLHLDRGRQTGPPLGQIPDPPGRSRLMGIDQTAPGQARSRARRSGGSSAKAARDSGELVRVAARARPRHRARATAHGGRGRGADRERAVPRRPACHRRRAPGRAGPRVRAGGCRNRATVPASAPKPKRYRAAPDRRAPSGRACEFRPAAVRAQGPDRQRPGSATSATSRLSSGRRWPPPRAPALALRGLSRSKTVVAKIWL